MTRPSFTSTIDWLATADRRFRDRQNARTMDADRLADLGMSSRRDLMARMR